MKKIILCCFFLLITGIIKAQTVSIPDVKFKAALIAQGVDTNSNGSIETAEALAITNLNLDVPSYKITNLTGITSFANLVTLDCSYNLLTSLDVRGLTNLQTLDCASNPLTSIDVRGLTSLQTLDCSYNLLTSLDVRGLTNLQTLDCASNPLTSIDFSGLTSLLRLDLSYSRQLTSLDLRGLSSLQHFDCRYSDKLTSLNASGLTNLQYLSCIVASNGTLTSLNVSGSTNLQTLDCFGNQLTSLDVSGLINLKQLSCSSNKLTSLDVSGLINLKQLSCSSNKLTSLDVSGLTSLQNLLCGNNLLISIDVSGLTNLQLLDCGANQFTSLNVSGLTSLQRLICQRTQLTSLDVSGLTNLIELTCGQNQFTSLDVRGLTNLRFLNCVQNKLTSLNVSGLTNLVSLTCFHNQLTNLDVSGLTNLEQLTCFQNKLTSLDFLGLTNLKRLNCYGNQLTSIDVSSLTNLIELGCAENQLTSLDVNRLTSLYYLDCGANQLTSLDVSKLTKLEYLFCSDNLLTSLNVSKLTKLIQLYCPSETLTCIQVGNVAAANANQNWGKSYIASYSIFCGTQVICYEAKISDITPIKSGIKWYSAATGGTVLATTTLLETMLYYYTQTINGVESPRTAVNVIVNPLPTTPTSVTSADSLLICKYIGTSNPITFAAIGGSTYAWTVPKGATIISGTETGTIGVSFAGVTAITGIIGTVTARVIDTNGCISAPTSITLSTKAPTAPGTISTSDAVLCKFIGTTNEVTYAVPAVAGTTYNWSTPAGVNVIADASATDNSITVNFLGASTSTSVGGVGTISVSAINSFGCSSSAPRSLALTSKLPTSPASLTLTSGDTKPHFNLRDVGSDPATYSFVGLNALANITRVGPYIDTETVFTLTAPPAATAASYAWTLPAGVNPIGDVTGNVITVDFADVVPGIGVLPIAVQSVGGCGQSVTTRNLNLARALPTAPTALVLTESPSGTAITRVSPYTGKTTELTLTATPVLVQGATATSYAWILPTGVNCITTNTPTIVKQSVNTGTFTPEGAPIFEIRDFDAISTGTVSTITIDFADVEPGTLSFPLTVFAVNGAGNSRARTRVVNATAPATPGAITTPLLAAPKFNPTCATSTTIMVQVPAVAGATYAWTVAGGTERIVSGNGSNSIVVNVAGVTTTSLSVSVVASNGTGSSLPRTLAIGKTIVCSAKIAPETEDTLFDVIAYPNPSSSEFTIETSAKGAINVKVYDMQGRLVEKADTNKVGSRLAAGTYNVIVNQGTNVKTLRVIKK